MNTKMVVAMMLAASISAGAWAVGFLGTPTAEIGQGKWSIGYDYSYSSQDFKNQTFKWTEIIDGVVTDFDTFRPAIKDVKIQRHFATIGYGLTDAWDVYIKLGIADVKGRGRQEDGSPWFSANFDNKFAWGWGTRYTFFKDNTIAWGAALQMNWLDTEYIDKGEGYRDTYEFSSYDVLVSAGPTVDMGGWKLYGGPFYYYLSGDIKLDIVDFEDDGVGGITTEMYKIRGDAKARSNIGGFIGANFDLAANTAMTVELASTTRGGWGLGAGIAYTF